MEESLSQRRIDIVPMIMIEGVDERINNRRLKQVYEHLNPTRCRMVYRSGRCLRKAGIEFSSESDAKEAIFFSQDLVIDGNIIRNARLATITDRDWFRKPTKIRNRKEKNKVTQKKEILSKILYSSESTAGNSTKQEYIPNSVEWDTTPIPSIQDHVPEINLKKKITKYPKKTIGKSIEMINKNSTFVIVSVERLVNYTPIGSSSWTFPYEIAMTRFTLEELASGNVETFHRLMQNNNIPEGYVLDHSM